MELDRSSYFNIEIKTLKLFRHLAFQFRRSLLYVDLDAGASFTIPYACPDDARKTHQPSFMSLLYHHDIFRRGHETAIPNAKDNQD